MRFSFLKMTINMITNWFFILMSVWKSNLYLITIIGWFIVNRMFIEKKYMDRTLRTYSISFGFELLDAHHRFTAEESCGFTICVNSLVHFWLDQLYGIWGILQCLITFVFNLFIQLWFNQICETEEPRRYDLDEYFPQLLFCITYFLKVSNERNERGGVFWLK